MFVLLRKNDYFCNFIVYGNMIEYIKGEIVDLSPAAVVIDNGGMGYSINISLITYSNLTGKKKCKLYIYEAIRDDAFILYGFLTKEERELFLQLISVSGIGAGTARIILSSLSPVELRDAILTENVALIKSVKGIGLKTAQRIIVDLKDKIGKSVVDSSLSSVISVDKSEKTEAVSALVMLGFQQNAALKVVEKIVREQPSLTLEQIIKLALKML